MRSCTGKVGGLAVRAKQFNSAKQSQRDFYNRFLTPNLSSILLQESKPSMRGLQDAADRFQEKEVPPHDGFIDAQFLMEMIDPMLDDAFPAGFIPGQIPVGAEGIEDR